MNIRVAFLCSGVFDGVRKELAREPFVFKCVVAVDANESQTIDSRKSPHATRATAISEANFREREKMRKQIRAFRFEDAEVGWSVATIWTHDLSFINL